MNKPKIALQIYTLRNEMQALGIPEVLKRVRAMGYDGVEWYGLLGHTPAELAQITRDAGLEPFSLHITAAEIFTLDAAALAERRDAGFIDLPIGSLPKEKMAGGTEFEATREGLMRLGALAKETGVRILYHNHDFDLAVIDGKGTRALDALYAALPADILYAEPDTCWLYSGGVDAVAYTAKYAGRTPVLHCKDCVKEGGRSCFMPVGCGVLDFEGILKASKAPWLCVEQDSPNPGMDAFACAEVSCKNLKRLLAEQE